MRSPIGTNTVHRCISPVFLDTVHTTEPLGGAGAVPAASASARAAGLIGGVSAGADLSPGVGKMVGSTRRRWGIFGSGTGATCTT